ncbi:MAG: protein kinase [Synechococcales cyanobacterium CRU_2_2]|nr:protein kinase [Synechococcales cyanobacterium CRU_2_2]
MSPLRHRQFVVRSLRSLEATATLESDDPHIGISGPRSPAATASCDQGIRLSDPGIPAHFEQEAGVLGNIWHPSLPKVDIDEDGFFAVDTTSDRYPEVHCLVMEKVAGETMEALIAQQGKVSQSQALNWLSQLVEILHILHQKNIFHRDIKPSNIMVKPDGQLVLIDFGSVREVTQTYLCKLGAGTNEVTQMNGITVLIRRLTRPMSRPKVAPCRSRTFLVWAGQLSMP